MIPVLILVGLPNVGKSTFFNKVTSNNNITSNHYGVTVNRSYKLCDSFIYNFFIVDNKGFNFYWKNKNKINYNLYLNESDLILFFITLENDIYKNKSLIKILKKYNKYIFLVLNKIDRKVFINIFEVLSLGLGKPYLVSALFNYNIKNIINNIFNIFCFNKNCIKNFLIKKKFKVSIIGDTNSGKSTFINYLFKENRNIISNKEKSTKDAIFLNLKYKNSIITFIDTFGIKYKKYNNKKIEKVFVNKTLKNIIKSNTIIFIIYFNNNFKLNIKYINFVIDNGLNLIIVISKSDLINLKEKIKFKNLIKRKIKKNIFYIFFISFCKKVFINYIIKYTEKVLNLSILEVKTNKINRILKNFFNLNKIFKKKLNTSYIHQAGKNPLIFIIYLKRYNFTYNIELKRFLVEKLKLKSVGIFIKFIKS